MRDWTPEYSAARERWASGAGRVHGLGAGGVGMAALLELMRARGFQASGCDTSAGRLTRWLEARGVPVAIGHDAAHADAADWIVHTAAVPADHPELRRAHARGIPVTTRGIALAARMAEGHTIAVSGTHGKTTTASLLAQVLRACGLDSAFAIGGEVDPLGGVAGTSPSPHAWLVAEADESDGTLAWYEPWMLLVNNVDFDHMEHFSGVEEFHAVFDRALRRTRGPVIYGWDDSAARRLASAQPDAISFGFGDGADVRPTRWCVEGAGQRFALVVHGTERAEVRLPMTGRHNALNALGALVAAHAAGVDWADGAAALANAVHARRRMDFARRGEITVVSDYAHHPAEIRAFLGAVRELAGERRGRLIALFQPHRYTRTLALGPDFGPAFEGVDRVILAPVYAASESPLAGGTSADLILHLRAGHGYTADLAESLDDAWNWATTDLRPGDWLLLIGAGDIERLAARAGELDPKRGS